MHILGMAKDGGEGNLTLSYFVGVSWLQLSNFLRPLLTDSSTCAASLLRRERGGGFDERILDVQSSNGTDQEGLPCADW